ncbi:MAG: hypothetical protein QOD00_3511, partial [Blastocatellia bacterium]|nr:hypothetical protein [Blastocatellia bacterium]
DIIVGSPIANRTRAEVEDLIGFFVNTLVLRTDLTGDPEFRELLRRVREVTLGGYEHQEVPFEKLVEELQPERDMSRSPLFQVMFMLQNEPVEALEMTGLRIRHVPVEGAVEMFDLTLIMNETGEGLRGALSYSTDLFDETTIRRMCEHFEKLLEGIVADPHQRLSELPLLTAKEQEQLLVQWNDTHFELREKGQLLQHMFEAQVARTPEGVALVYEGASLKYGELDQRANRLANYLAKMGVGPEAIVGVMMERSLDLVVGLLGVLKAGGAYLPLDPQYPQERLRWMLEDSGAQVVLTEARLLDRIDERTTRAVCLDEDWETIAAESDKPPARMMSAGHPAYVIYTSGSTGQPKGVLIPHRAICNRLEWGAQVFPLNETDRILQSTTISFDVSVWEFFAPLVEGAGLVLPKPGGHQEIAYLAELIEREKITILNLVPSLLQVLMEDERFRQCRSLRQVFVGGEAMPVGLPARFFSQSSAELYNLYGPTETTIDATWWRCSPEDAERRSIPIGRPIGNLQIYLLDQYFHLVPAGVAGELYIGGEGLARGYLNRPELTAEKFIPHPYGTSAGARLYRTGDLARYLPDGQLEFLRRVDDQVKIRGFRIETGEIEAALLKHPSVRNAIVRVSPSVPAQPRLVAYVITSDNGEVTGRELRDFLKQRLPEYFIPSSFMLLDQFPLTPNGKVDVRALPLHETVAQDKDETDSIRYTPTEEMLARVWSEILRVERVRTHDNFFDLGGHSLLAMQLMSRVREVFGVDVSVRQLFEAPTLAGLAHHLEASQQRAGQVRQPPLVPAPRVGGLPLSFAQQRLWFLEQMRPGSPAYNIPVALRLKGQLDVRALEQSLNEIVRRHEALRTNFRSINGEPVQVVQAFEPEPLAINDLSAMPERERESLVKQLSTAEAGRPFQLESGRMIRAALLRLRADEHALLVTLHHIVADDWSFGILIRELSELYRAFSSGQPSTLPELSIQYADFAAWQRAWLTGEVLEAQLAYWRKQLAGAPPLLALPTDHPRPAVQSARGGVETLWLDARLTAALRQLSLEEGVTLFMTLLAAFQVLLSRYTHQQDIIVGSPIANRTRAEVEDLIG